MAPGPGARVRRDERGYIAVTTGLILIVLMAFSAFAVDVGNWYLTGQRAQRAADAAALAGVTRLPGNQAGAFGMANDYAANNGFTDGAASTMVTESLSGSSTRLRVDVSRTVDNIFGPLLGRPRTTISRHAVADYAGPVPLGSPCNRFGDDPQPGATASSNCDDTGQFWASVGSPAAAKVNGDAFQNGTCTTEDGCSAGQNTDYDPNGHVFTVTLRQAVSQLKLEAFDPAQVVVGDLCDENDLAAAQSLAATDTVVTDPAQRYAPKATPWCTGDQDFGPLPSTGLVRTEFVIRSPGANQWDPTSWPIVNRCTQVFEPYNADLAAVLDTRTAQYADRKDVAANFRQWVTLCDFPGTTEPGTYAIQVFTNGLGADDQGGHNRFGLRASGSGVGDDDAISISGFEKMVMYGNTPSGTSKFFLARIPSSSNGQILDVHLFDIGDGAQNGSTVTVLPPREVDERFSGCTGKGVTTGALTDCSIPVNASYDGTWQTITVPIPTTYRCEDSAASGCWVRLQFYYGDSSLPDDTTSWWASVEGDPIRLVE